MDYKKEYEEMVQRARELHKGGNALTKKQMEIVCPELAESEDKRVNEEIRNFLIDMECKREWISYLEKQKEQPVDAKSGRVIKAARRVLNNWLDGTDCPNVSGDFTELEYAFREYDGEEKQKEQKPDIEICPHSIKSKSYSVQEPTTFSEPYNPDDYEVVLEGNATSLRRKEQNLTEWSENDKRILEEAIGMIAAKGCWVRSDDAVKQVSDFLKSLPERFNLQPKQEWSEEDKRKLNMLYSIVSQAADAHAFFTTTRLISDRDAIELHDFLKSLRPQSHWKPSEEQMKALNTLLCARDFSYHGQHSQLQGLYNELKTL